MSGKEDDPSLATFPPSYEEELGSAADRKSLGKRTGSGIRAPSHGRPATWYTAGVSGAADCSCPRCRATCCDSFRSRLAGSADAGAG